MVRVKGSNCCVPGCHLPMTVGNAQSNEEDWSHEIASGFSVPISNICCQHIPKQICVYFACTTGTDSDGNYLVGDSAWYDSYDQSSLTCASQIGGNQYVPPSYTGIFDFCETGRSFEIEFKQGPSGVCYFAMDFGDLGLDGDNLTGQQAALTGIERAALCHKCDLFCATGCYSGDPTAVINGNTVVNPCAVKWVAYSGDDPTADTAIFDCLGCKTGIVWALPKQNTSVPRQRACCTCDNKEDRNLYTNQCQPICDNDTESIDGNCKCVSQSLCVRFMTENFSCLYTYTLPYSGWEWIPDVTDPLNLRADNSGTCDPCSGTGDCIATGFHIYMGAESGDATCACKLHLEWDDDKPYTPKSRTYTLGTSTVPCPDIRIPQAEFTISGASPPDDWLFVDIKPETCVPCSEPIIRNDCCGGARIPTTLNVEITCSGSCTSCASGQIGNIEWNDVDSEWQGRINICNNQVSIAMNCTSSGLRFDFGGGACLDVYGIGAGTCDPFNMDFGVQARGIGCCGGIGAGDCTITITE